MIEDGPAPGVERARCDECGGYDDFHTDGSVVQVHQDGCPNFIPCGCGEDDCEECAVDAHFWSPSLVSIGLRLMIAAMDDDPEAVVIALKDIPDCGNCERVVWLSVLRTLGGYGFGESGLADRLRKDLLGVLDAAEIEQAGWSEDDD